MLKGIRKYAFGAAAATALFVIPIGTVRGTTIAQ
jgi:hypothetical protein